jgi:protein O-GlcNAc transferase
MSSAPLLIVAASRLEREAFAKHSLLGRSLALAVHAGYNHSLRFGNRRALAYHYNQALAQADAASIVVFCHDDVWLGEQPLGAALNEALQRFDLVGVAGRAHGPDAVQAWWLRPDGTGWDHPHLVGRIWHGTPEAPRLQAYGPSPAAAAVLDGVFLAGRAGVLRCAGLRFDPQLPFHFYDLDCCRSAAQAGLRLGVWPLELIHSSNGAALSPTWKASAVLYRQKWEPPGAAAVGPEAVRWRYALARAHQLLEQWPAALAGYDAVLELEPQHSRALQQRALVLHRLDRLQEALISLDAALALDPDNASAIANRVSLVHALEGPAAAELALRGALAQRPTDTELLYRLGSLQARQQQRRQALDTLRQLLRLDRQHIPGLLELGGLLMEEESFALARSAFLRVLRQQPHHLGALFGLCQCLEACGDNEAALASANQGLAHAPEDLNLGTLAESLRLALCLWDDDGERMRRLIRGLERAIADAEPVPMAVPMRLLTIPLPLELPGRVAALYASGIAALMPPLVQVVPRGGDKPQPATPHCGGSRGDRPLRVGYLSADFRCHAMGGLLHAVFAQHDRSRCLPIGYMLASSRDRFTRAVARGCERLRDASRLGSEQLARLIRDDGIDVLVDLMGYTHQGRPSLLALRPAPLQLHYLGYPGSLGAPFLDGIVADGWLIPPELEHGYREPVWRLPHAFICSAPLPADPGEDLPPPPSRAALGLAPDQMVYACFNRPEKFDPQRFDAWMTVLRGVPGSVLLLALSQPIVQKRLRQRAQTCGVDPSRLVFTAKTPAAQYPALCHMADLFLDTAHYGAGATGAMALQAGLPLLTSPGEAFVSRMGASLCASVGMADLICPDEADYIAQAMALGRDRERLAQRRRQLLDPTAHHPLFEVGGWVRRWEELLLNAAGSSGQP